MGLCLRAAMLIDAAPVVKFDGGLFCCGVAQRRFVVLTTISVVHTGVAKTFVICGVISDAAIGALLGLHGVWPRRDGVLFDR